MSNDCLWLEVSNARIEGTNKIEVQLKGDRELNWWTVDPSDTAKEVFHALESKRLILAGITGANGNGLVVSRIRLQFQDTASR